MKNSEKKQERYVCVGTRINDADKKVKMFVKLTDNNILDKNNTLLFKENKSDKYWFSHIYLITETINGYIIKFTSDNINLDDSYILENKAYEDILEKNRDDRKLKTELKMFEKEYTSIDHFMLATLRNKVLSNEISLSMFKILITNFINDVYKKYYKK